MEKPQGLGALRAGASAGFGWLARHDPQALEEIKRDHLQGDADDCERAERDDYLDLE